MIRVTSRVCQLQFASPGNAAVFTRCYLSRQHSPTTETTACSARSLPVAIELRHRTTGQALEALRSSVLAMSSEVDDEYSSMDEEVSRVCDLISNTRAASRV